MATTIAIAGDWHGNTGWALRAIAAIPDDVDLLIHLGDFGLMGAGFDRYLHKINRASTARDLQIRVLPGNHENYGWIAKQPTDTEGLIDVAERIRLYPRGHRFSVANVSFCAVGGAVSVDQGRRTPGRTWWPNEEVREDEAEAIANGGHVDVLLTHDAPLGSDAPGLPQRELVEWAGAEVVAKAYLHQKRIRQITDALSPSRLLHGHMHARYTRTLVSEDPVGHPYECIVDGLSCDDMVGNVVLLTVDGGRTDLRDLAVDPQGRPR